MQTKDLVDGGADEIKSHPFFRGVDWNTIRRSRRTVYKVELHHRY